MAPFCVGAGGEVLRSGLPTCSRSARPSGKAGARHSVLRETIVTDVVISAQDAAKSRLTFTTVRCAINMVMTTAAAFDAYRR